MIPVLFKKDEQQFRNYGLGPIHDIINPKVTRERNGQYLLYFQYPQDAKFSDVFAEEMRIKSDAGVRTKWQTFEISRVVRKEGQLIEVFAKHISQSLLKDALRPSVNIRNANAQQALGTWNNSRIGDEDFDVWSDITTVSSTSWSIQDVSNAFEALAGVQGSILDIWGGEYEFDNKLIRLHKEMGRKSPVPLEYGRNITGLEQDIQDDTVYTSIYPFATYTKEGASEPTIVTLPEYYVDGKYINMHSKRKIQVVDFSGEFEPDDIPTASRLRTLATQYAEANEVGAPHENIKIEYIDLAKTLDYKDFETMEEVELNDRLPIFYPKFGITNENAKAVVVNYDPVKEENISIELGIIGQSFRTVTTGGIGSRLDRIEQEQKETKKYIVNAEGNRIWFETPEENIEHKIGDTWFEKNGPYERIRVWNGNQWEIIIDTEDIDKIAKEVAQQQLELDEVKQTADEAVDRINGEIADNFTNIEAELVNVEELSNTAYTNALVSLDHSLDALALAGQAIENTGSLSIRVDDVENELTIKADKQVVDDLENIVNLQALDIKANADGLALKANQDTVDLLNSTVSSLGTDIGVVAGQVNSRVWNTDIESAIDGLSYENRNLFRNSDFSSGMDFWSSISGNTMELVEEGLRMIVSDPTVVTPRQFLDLNFKSGDSLVLSVKVKSLSGNFAEFRGRIANTLDLDLVRQEALGNDWDLFVFKGLFQQEVNIKDYAIGFLGGQGDFILSELKLEKGSKATDWSLAPEDTLTRFDHIETEWTQTFDSFAQSVAHIDGRVTNIRQDVDSITGTVADHTGKIANIEFNVSGMQGIISDPANGLVTQVSALAGGLNVLASDFANLEYENRNLLIQSEFLHDTALGGSDGFPTAVGMANTSSFIQVENRKFITVSRRLGTTNNDNGDTNFDFFRWAFYKKDKSLILVKDTTRGGVYPPLEIKIPEEAYYVRFSSSRGDLFNLQAEFGVKATDWTPAPEDMATQAQLSVLNDNINMRVSKGELLSQINIEAGRTLIQSDRLYLDASSVVFSGNAFIPSAAIQNLTADKITTGTLNAANVKIINLDFNTAVGNATEFVESHWNGINENVRINSRGISMYGSDLYRYNDITDTGIILYGGYGGARRAGTIGYFKPSFAEARPYEAIMDVSEGGKHYVGFGVNENYDFAIGFERYAGGDSPRIYQRTANVNGQTGTWTFLGNVSVRNSSGITYGSGESRIQEAETRLEIRSRGELRLYNSIDSLKMRFGGSAHLYSDLNMNNNSIFNQSDERLKTKISLHTESSLDKIMDFNFVDFVWIEDNREDFGVIAQQIQQIAPELISENEEGMLSLNNTRLAMMTTHAVQQLALREENTNKVASQALQLSETNEEKIKRLEKRIEELEGEVA